MEIGLSSTGTNSGTLESVGEEARHAAAAGLASFWVPNFFGMDALTTLAIVGREVPDIRLGTAVVPIFTRHPFAMVQQALTVQTAVDGRLTLGIGLSHKPVVEGAWGASFERPATAMQHYLEELAVLTAPDTYDAVPPAVPIQPTPPRVPGATRLPILVAAIGKRMVEIAGRLADGVVLWAAGPTVIASLVEPLLAAARDAGRSEPRVVASLPVCVTADASGARDRIARWYGAVGELPTYRRALDGEGVEGVADISLVGGESAVAGGLRRLEDAGVTEFTAMVTANAAERAATMDALGRICAGSR